MASRLAVISFLDEGGAPVYPGHGLPSAPVYPSGGPVLPPGGATLPVYPFDPTDPGYGKPEGGRPDNTLPGAPGHPSTGPIVPGRRFIVKYLACVGLILVPDHELPATPEPK